MKDCIFCKIVKGEAKSWKVMESENAYAFLDIHPANKYHTLVIPKAHFENIYDITDTALKDVISLTRKVCKLYEEKLGIKNVQIISSNGKEAQQDVFHIHFHFVPRSLGDGQNIRWHTHPEWLNEFDEMIKKLNED